MQTLWRLLDTVCEGIVFLNNQNNYYYTLVIGNLWTLDAIWSLGLNMFYGGTKDAAHGYF